MENLKYFSIGAIGIGITLSFTGFIFRSLELIDIFNGTISGPIFLGLGVVLFFIYRFKVKKS